VFLGAHDRPADKALQAFLLFFVILLVVGIAAGEYQKYSGFTKKDLK